MNDLQEHDVNVLAPKTRATKAQSTIYEGRSEAFADLLLPKDKRGGPRPGAGRPPGIKETQPRRKGLTSDECLQVLTIEEEKRYWRKLIASAGGDPKLMLQVLTKVSELRRGKPFDAVNPRAVKQTPSDNRLMVAIQNILPDGGKGSSKAKLLKAKKVEDE